MGYKLDFNNDAVKEKLKIVLFKSMMKMTELAVINAPFDTGALSASINLQPPRPGYSRYILRAGKEYAADVEYGTSPHHVSPDDLAGWAKRVLGDEDKAFAVAEGIGRKGTEAQPFMRPALDQVKIVWVPRYFEQVFSK